MPSVRHPEVFRRAFVDALSLLHVESVVLRHSIPGDPDSPLVPTRVAGARRQIEGARNRFFSVNGTARYALAVDLTTALNATPVDCSSVDPKSGVAWNHAFRQLQQGAEQGGPRHAEYFILQAGTHPFPDGGGLGQTPRGNSYDARALDLVNEAKATWARLDANVFTPLDATIAAEARAVVAGARISYVTQLNAMFGAGVYS